MRRGGSSAALECVSGNHCNIMEQQQITCCVLGGQERDLYVLGELHKQPGINIAFVYDRDANAVGMEIAEILGIDRAVSVEQIAARTALDVVVVPEPRERFAAELEALAGTGARVLSQPQALDELCPRPKTAQKARKRAESAPYSVEDALAAFERLFDRDKLLEFLLDVAVRAAGAQAGSIMLYSDEAEELYIAYATGLSERVVRNTRQRLGEGIAGIVARERRGRLIRHAPGRTSRTLDRDRPDVSSAISVPLIVDDRLLGVLNVSCAEDGPELTQTGLSTLERLSVRIARLLGESLRLQQTRAGHQEMRLRRSVGELSERDISSTARFTMISNFLAELVGAETAEIFVATHEGDWLVLGGSNRRLSAYPEMVRCDRGALARAFLDRRTVILSEKGGLGPEDSMTTSCVFAPLVLGSPLGVLMLEFSQRHRLDEFLGIKDSVALELGRFIASQRRERRMEREVAALSRVSENAPVLLACRTLEDLCDYVARMVCDILDCERASVRVLTAQGEGKVGRYEDAERRDVAWSDEDDERFLKLKTSGEGYSLAFFDYATVAEAPRRRPAAGYHSLIAVPIRIDGRFSGGIIAYDRRPSAAIEDATFTDLDRAIVDQIVAIAASAIRTLSVGGPTAEPGDTATYQTVLSGNMQRLKKVVDTEMARADRYHHSFSLLAFKIRSLDGMFDSDPASALALIDEISRGIQTRTRKTDFGAWIRRDTFAMLSLEGSKRVKFLVSRLLVYLLKDFATVAGEPIERADVLVGHAAYPGVSRTPEALLAEAESAAVPHDTDGA